MRHFRSSLAPIFHKSTNSSTASLWFLCLTSASEYAKIPDWASWHRRERTLLRAFPLFATGLIHAQSTELKRRVEFLDFMDRVVAEIPIERQIHVILDYYCIHKRNDPWLDKHPNVFFHFTPTSASWLNQAEIWFGIMSRKALRGASFKSSAQLIGAINDFITAYSQSAKPFVWRKREVKGSQLRNTIVNLRN